MPPLKLNDPEQPFLHLNLGHVLTIATILGTVGVTYAALQSTLATHDVRIGAVERQQITDEGHWQSTTDMLSKMESDMSFIRGRMGQPDRRGEIAPLEPQTPPG